MENIYQQIVCLETPEPPILDKRWKKIKDKHYHLDTEKSDPKKVFPDLAQIYLDNNQIEEETKKFNEKILVEESNAYQAELNNYKAEIDSEIEKIRRSKKLNNMKKILLKIICSSIYLF